MDPEALEAMNLLRDFMFERVYLRPEAEDQRTRAIEIIRDLVEHYIAHPEGVPPTYQHDDADGMTRAIDYVSGMTDRFAIREWEQLN
jgi:dGTPase